jgi:hypothetical protein
MTLHALRAGREMGYRVGVLGASAMGYPVYRQICFRDCATRSLMYIWDGATA